MDVDRNAAGGGHYRLVGARRLRLEGFELDDATWEELRIPVEMACFYHSSQSGRVAAFYPSPMGATESRLEKTGAAWDAHYSPVSRTASPADGRSAPRPGFSGSAAEAAPPRPR